MLRTPYSTQPSGLTQAQLVGAQNAIRFLSGLPLLRTSMQAGSCKYMIFYQVIEVTHNLCYTTIMSIITPIYSNVIGK